jgi:hypothetical protein
LINFAVLSAMLWALLPMAVFVLLRSRSERPAWWLAVDIPAALALDLVATALLSRLVLLDVAIWLTKASWLVLGATVFFIRRRRGWRPSWPSELPREAVAQALLVGLIALIFSLTMSRPCALWDRQFHVPLLTSLRGQTSPFVPAYEPWRELHYHYGGNLLATSLQATSFSILHASHALSLVHDWSCFWLGVTTTLVLRRLGLKQTTLLVLVYLLMYFASPVLALEGQKRPWYGGYSSTTYMSLSMRPHVAIGMLAALPLFALPLLRLTELRKDIAWSELAIPLLPLIPFLLIVDEFAVGVLGLGLAAVWLVYPRVFAVTRRQGVYLFAGLGLAMLFGLLVMNGTVSPGAPNYRLRFSFPSSPGFYAQAWRLDTAPGIRYFISDLLGILGVFLAGAWLSMRSRHPLVVGGFVMYATVAIVSVLLFSTLLYSGSGRENHRFITALMLFCPLFAVAWLVPRPGVRPRLSGVPELVAVLSLVASAVSGVDWYTGEGARACEKDGISTAFYDTNCRSEVAATVVTERTRPMYVDPAILYLYIGCRPAFVVGPQRSLDGHDLRVGPARSGIAALQEFAHEPRFQSPTAPITVACAREASTDPACKLLQRTEGACKPAGAKASICSMTPEQLRDVLTKWAASHPAL